MPAKKPKPRKKPVAPSPAANDAMRKALTMPKPAGGWPWGKARKKK